MLPEHSSVIADSDVVDMCDRTLEAMRWFEHDRATLDEQARRGHDWVRTRHNGSVVRERLDAAFGAITAPGSPSLLPESVTLSHYQAHAGSADAYSRARVVIQSAGRRVLDRLRGVRG